MKIVCVSGGSYKSFYLNHFASLKRCDLLVFNFGIIYDYVVKDELLDYGVVTKELMHLSNALGAVVVAGVNVVRNGGKTRALIVCDGDKVYLSNLKTGVKICLDKRKNFEGLSNSRAQKLKQKLNSNNVKNNNNLKKYNKNENNFIKYANSKNILKNIKSDSNVLIKFKNCKHKINQFIIGDKTTDFLHYNKIILTDKRINVNLMNCSYKKTYIFCNKHGTDVVQNRILKRYNYKVSVLKID